MYPPDDYYAYTFVEQIARGRSAFARLTDRLRRWAIVVASPQLLRARPWWQRLGLRIATIPARQRFRGLPAREPGRLLDVGCGDGAFGLYLRDSGWTVYGVEFHPSGASRARAQGLEIFEGNFTRGAVPWRDLDIVRMWHVLEHLSEPRAALAKAYELLAPGGELIVGVPNASALYRRLFGARWAAIQAPQHLIHFTPATLRRMVADAGFADIRIQQGSVGTGLSSIAAWCPKSWERVLMNPACRAASILSDMALDAAGLGDALELRAMKPRTR